MAKHVTYSITILISTVFFSLVAAAKCNTLSGDWQGTYQVKPYYFGFAVGYCNYSSTINISHVQNQLYHAIIANTLVNSKGRAGKSCQQAFIVKAKMTCDVNGVMLITEEGKSLPHIDMHPQWQEDGALVSSGDFDHQYDGRTLDINYSFTMEPISAE